jgi:hypothetical protein
MLCKGPGVPAIIINTSLNLITIQTQEKGIPKKAAFKPLKIFLEFFLNVEV